MHINDDFDQYFCVVKYKMPCCASLIGIHIILRCRYKIHIIFVAHEMQSSGVCSSKPGEVLAVAVAGCCYCTVVLYFSIITTSNCANNNSSSVPLSLLRLCAAALALLLLLLLLSLLLTGMLLLLLDHLQLLLLLELRGAHRHRYRLAVGDLVDQVAAPGGRHSHLELSA